MSNRLDKEREAEFNTKRMEYAKDAFIKRNIPILYYDKYSITIQYKCERIRLYVYTGWFTGKGIKDGRGIQNLLKQLK